MSKEPTKGIVPNELAPPTSAYDEVAQEILRIWITGKGGMDVAIRSSFSNPEPWGMLLVDIARHAARICEMEDKCSYDDALSRLKAQFDAEWEHPTDHGRTSPALKQ